MDAAARAFIDEGYERTSMDRIAERAGASKRTVYNHFTGKEELFQAVLRRLLDETAALKQIPYRPDASLRSQLNKFAEAKIAFTKSEEWLGMLKVTAGVFSSHPELAEETIQYAEQNDTLIDWLEAATADGRMTVSNPRLTASVFWSMIGGAFFWPAVFHGPIADKDIRPLKAEMLDMFLERYAV